MWTSFWGAGHSVIKTEPEQELIQFFILFPLLIKEKKMSVTILLELQVEPEAVDEMISFLKEILPDTRVYEGCQGLEVQQNQEDSSNLVMVEKWESRQFYEKYIGWRTETGVMDKIGSMLSQPPSIRYYDLVEA